MGVRYCGCDASLCRRPTGSNWVPAVPRLVPYGFSQSSNISLYIYVPRQRFSAECSGSIYPPAVASRTISVDSLTDLGIWMRCFDAPLVVIAFASILLPDTLVLERDGTALGIPIAVFAYESHEKASRLRTEDVDRSPRWGWEYQRLAKKRVYRGHRDGPCYVFK